MGLTLSVLGIDHRHIHGMLGHMLDAGRRCAGAWTDGTPSTAPRFQRDFPDLTRADNWHRLSDDLAIDLASMAIEATQAGKDVTVDKSGCLTMQDLAALRATVAETGRIWTVNSSERTELPAVAAAERLVRDVRDRTETAVAQEHTLRVTEIALRAQAMTDARG